MGIGIGVAGGVGVGIGWHIMTVHADPPGIAIYIVEAGLVALILLMKPKTPHSPNFNLIPIIH
jgi:hypothetical protein